MWNSFQILNAYVQWAVLQDYIFEIKEISNVLEPWNSLGSPERKHCHSTDPRKCCQIVLLYTWKYWVERNLSQQVMCLLQHFSVVSTALPLEMTECKMSGIMATKSFAFIELHSAPSPFYNRNVTSKIKACIYMYAETQLYMHIQCSKSECRFLQTRGGKEINY